MLVFLFLFLTSMFFELLASNQTRVECGTSEIEVTRQIFFNENVLADFTSWDRPVQSFKDPITVHVSLFLSSIVDINEATQDVSLKVTFEMMWHDQIHIWNETEPINCTEYIIIPHGTNLVPVWSPLLYVVNSDKPYDLTNSKDSPMRIYSNGKATYATTKTLDFKCEFDMTAFPFDRHGCEILLDSSRYKFQQQQLKSSIFAKVQFQEHSAWTLELAQSTASNFFYSTGNSFANLKYRIILIRKPSFYLITFIGPLMIIAITEFISFALPVKSEIRIAISFTCLLANSVFVGVFQSEIPHNSESLPLLFIYINIISGSISLVILVQALALFSYRKRHSTPMALKFAKISNISSIIFYLIVLFIGGPVVVHLIRNYSQY